MMGTRARLEVELFGKSGQKLDTLLAGGSQAINELTNAAQKLGVVLSEDSIAKADETADKLSAIKQVLEANIARTVADNSTAILSLADSLSTLVIAAGKAAQAMVRFKANQAIAFEEQFTSGVGQYLVSGDRRKLAKNRINRYRDVLVANGGSVTDPEYLRQKSLSDARKLMGYQPPQAATPDGALPTVKETARHTRAPRAPSGPTAVEIEAKHREDIRALFREQLQAELSLTNDAEARAELQSQILTEEFEERKTRVENDEHFTKEQKDAQVKLLKALYGMSGEGDNIVVGGNGRSLAAGITRERDERLAREAFDLKASEISLQQESLQGQLALAETDEERRRIALELVYLEYQLRVAKLDQLISSNETNDHEKKIAALTKARLGALKALDTEKARQGTAGPGERYYATLPTTPEKLNEALEQVRVDGIRGVEDGLLSIIDGTKSVSEAFRDMASSIISDLLRIAIQRSITIPLADALGLGGSMGNMMGPSVSGGGGLFGQLLGLGGMVLGSVRGGGLSGVNTAGLAGIESSLHSATLGNMGSFMLPGMANGGTIGGFPGVDTNILSINGIPRVRVSANERIRVEPNGSAGPRTAPAIGSLHMTFPGVTNAREGREAGRQAASALQAKIAAAKKQGY